MTSVTVIGAGFSGLVTSYYLAREGVPVRLIESRETLGGMLGTIETPHGRVERAAQSIRPSERFLALCRDLDVPLRGREPGDRARFIYRGSARRWPLNTLESAQLVARLGWNGARRKLKPRSGESIRRWGERTLGESATRFLVAPALQGIYAGDPDRLSASLILGRKPAAAERRFSAPVSPQGGMGQMINALESRLSALGVTIDRGVEADANLPDVVVVATSAHQAGKLLRNRAPATAKRLDRMEMVPLIRATLFYPLSEWAPRGLGMLFPRGQGITALGVLFNRSDTSRSETWILGGPAERNLLDLDDDELLRLLDHDRERAFGRIGERLAACMERWPEALPHYDLELEKTLGRRLDLPHGVHLVGNYLGGIGLTSLLEVAAKTARSIVGDRSSHCQVRVRRQTE